MARVFESLARPGPVACLLLVFAAVAILVGLAVVRGMLKRGNHLLGCCIGANLLRDFELSKRVG